MAEAHYIIHSLKYYSVVVTRMFDHIRIDDTQLWFVDLLFNFYHMCVWGGVSVSHSDFLFLGDLTEDSMATELCKGRCSLEFLKTFNIKEKVFNLDQNYAVLQFGDI